MFYFRDQYIEHLLHQVEQLSAELLKIRHDSQQEITELKQKILDMELRLAEKEFEVDEALKARQDIEGKLSEAAKSAHLGSVVQLQLQVRVLFVLLTNLFVNLIALKFVSSSEGNGKKS